MLADAPPMGYQQGYADPQAPQFYAPEAARQWAAPQNMDYAYGEALLAAPGQDPSMQPQQQQLPQEQMPMDPQMQQQMMEDEQARFFKVNSQSLKTFHSI